MTIGEIKIEALKLMFVNYENDIDTDNLESYYGEANYGSYLVNMVGAINRAFDRIKQKKVLRNKTAVLTGGTIGEYYTRYSIEDIADFYELERIIFEGLEGKYDGNIAYRMEGTDLLLKPLNEGEEYRIVYKPTITRVTRLTADSTEIALPDEIAGLIPYFIKAELYQEDEPALAAQARNIFEAGLDEIKPPAESKQNRITRIYDMNRL